MMSVNHWTPWREFRTMQQDLDRLWGGYTAPNTATVPSYNVSETEKAFQVTVDVPGVSPEEVRVSVKEQRLEVTAESKAEGRERHFHVAFALPADIDDAKLEAALEHGVLVLTLPKAPKPEAREIPVKIAGFKPAATA